MEIEDIVKPDAVRAGLKVQSKKRLIQEVAELAGQVLRLDVERVRAAIAERETLGPTGVGNGVAIPHARLDGISHVTGVFVRLDHAIEYESVDRKPVDLVFALFAPESAGAEHLKALARVSRTLRDEGVLAKLRSTDNAAAIYAILTEGAASRAA